MPFNNERLKYLPCRQNSVYQQYSHRWVVKILHNEKGVLLQIQILTYCNTQPFLRRRQSQQEGRDRSESTELAREQRMPLP